MNIVNNLDWCHSAILQNGMADKPVFDNQRTADAAAVTTLIDAKLAEPPF
jgi:hypothetical protein